MKTEDSRRTYACTTSRDEQPDDPNEESPSRTKQSNKIPIKVEGEQRYQERCSARAIATPAKRAEEDEAAREESRTLRDGGRAGKASHDVGKGW